MLTLKTKMGTSKSSHNVRSTSSTKNGYKKSDSNIGTKPIESLWTSRSIGISPISPSGYWFTRAEPYVITNNSSSDVHIDDYQPYSTSRVSVRNEYIRSDSGDYYLTNNND